MALKRKEEGKKWNFRIELKTPCGNRNIVKWKSGKEKMNKKRKHERIEIEREKLQSWICVRLRAMNDSYVNFWIVDGEWIYSIFGSIQCVEKTLKCQSKYTTLFIYPAVKFNKNCAS